MSKIIAGAYHYVLSKQFDLLKKVYIILLFDGEESNDYLLSM